MKFTFCQETQATIRMISKCPSCEVESESQIYPVTDLWLSERQPCTVRFECPEHGQWTETGIVSMAWQVTVL